MRKPLNSMMSALTAIVAAMSFAACTPDQRIINSARTPESTPAANRPPAPSGFEADVEAMRTADFSYIYVFRRKDGRELTAEDRKFINSQKPLDVNRVKVSDSGRAVIFGSNFRLPPEALESLRSAFAFEDLSRPEETPAANAASPAP